MLRVSPLVIALSLALLHRAAAQEWGDRVRLTLATASAPQLVGTLLRQDGDSLWLEVPGQRAPVSVARSTAVRLEISRGQVRSIEKGAGFGAGLGGLGGFVLSGVAASKSQWCDNPNLVHVCFVDTYARAFRGGLIGAAVGGLLGAAFGYAVRTERWDRVPLGGAHVVVAPRGAGLAISLTL